MTRRSRLPGPQVAVRHYTEQPRRRHGITDVILSAIVAGAIAGLVLLLGATDHPGVCRPATHTTTWGTP